MIKYEEHLLTPKQILCCEFFPDEETAKRRQKRLEKVIRREVMIMPKKNLKTDEGTYKLCWMVSYICPKG